MKLERALDIARHPRLLDRIFRVHPDLRKHLDALVIPVGDDPDGADRIRQLAYMRPGAKIVSVPQGTDEASLLLPRWMTDLSYGAELRAKGASSKRREAQPA